MVGAGVAEDEQVGLRGERVGVLLGEAGERAAVVGAPPQAARSARWPRGRPSSAPGRAPVSNRSVTSWISSTKVNARTRLNCSRSAKTSISVKLAKLATEPLTSQSTTRSVRPGRLGLWRVSIGTPPLDIDARTVRRKSSGRPRRGVLLAADPGRQPARERLDLAAHQLEVGLARGGEVDLLDRRAHGVPGDVLGTADLGRAAAYLRVDQPLEHPRLRLDQPPQSTGRRRVVRQQPGAAPCRRARRARPGSSRCTTTSAAPPDRAPGSARTAAPPRAPASPARPGRPSPARSPAPPGTRPAAWGPSEPDSPRRSRTALRPHLSGRSSRTIRVSRGRAPPRSAPGSRGRRPGRSRGGGSGA